MKKKTIIACILVLSTLLFGCVYQIPEEPESTPPHSDTSPSAVDKNEATQPTYYYDEWPDIEEPVYTEDDVVFTENGIIAGPFTFEYIDDTFTFDFDVPTTRLNGLNLVSCETNSELLVIPSAVCNTPVVAVGYHSRYEAEPDQPVFKNCTALRAVYISDAVLYIDDAAFVGCTKLTDVRLSHSINYLGAYGSDYGEAMFGDTEVKFLEVPEGVSHLGFYTFMASDIEYLVLPSSLTRIYTLCLDSCPLKEIYLRAPEEQYKESLLNKIAELTEATLYFYSETEPTEGGNFWHYVDGKPVIW